MLFNIHVAGSGGFRYSRNNVPSADEYDVNEVETELLKRGGVRTGGSPTAGATRFLTMVASYLHIVYAFEQSILALSAHGSGSLNIAIRHSNMWWPTTGGFRSLLLSGSATSARPIARELLRFLSRCDMAYWGPVIEMVDALTRFDVGYQGHSGYRINITLAT